MNFLINNDQRFPLTEQVIVQAKSVDMAAVHSEIAARGD